VYTAEDKPTFFSPFISGAQRLPNGNTLICSGGPAIVFEVTPDNKTVWQYKHPGGDFGRGGPRGGFPGFGMPRPGEILPEFLQDMLRLSDEQRQSIATLQKEVDEKLQAVLTDEQRQQLAEMGNFRPGGPGRFGPPGFGPPGFGPPGFGPGGPPPGDSARDGDQGPDRDRGPARDAGPGRDGDGRRGRGPGGGPGGLFRAFRYTADYPAFEGKTLTPGEKLDVLASASRNRPIPDDQGPDRPPRPETN
jgi:hypothetical protein